ncbi:aromatic amino acid permease [Calothrix parasitica NIES-267]|uniref:Aromatic amino acid permease n=1 Tax=Calothrix parasitica NIES-267 TaxID=1973488 RepID=A0A1Z4LNK9_9CYAN|nr:aromatic amino acid permease [Calothrix parasitica NIES-267]
MKAIDKLNISETTRLFSNLSFDGNKLVHKPGSVVGSTALIAGTTVGAGILALPAVTLPSGVLPSTALLIGVWLYTVLTGLLIAEVSLNGMRHSGRATNGLLAMVESTLGGMEARFAGGAYLFLHYALLIAYVSQGGEILISAIEGIWDLPDLPTWMGSTGFAVIFGTILYLGRDRFIERLNSFFVVVVITSFIGLLLLGATQVNPNSLLSQDWTALPPALSVMLVALFFHNIIPVVATQLEGDSSKVRQSIVVGSAIPLTMFLLWNAVILGSVTPTMLENIGSTSVFDPLQVLRAGDAGEWLGILVTVFSEFAIATSFIGFFYGLRDLFKDMNLFSGSSEASLPLISLILFPPMGFSALNPNIFYTALDYAGTFSVSILGGVIPAIMAWKQRDKYKELNQKLVPGGKLMLVTMIGIALMAIVLGNLK